MNFVDAVALVRRHKLLVVYGLLVACLLATFSAYRLDGTQLVSRGEPSYQSRAVVAVRPGAEQPTTTTVAPTIVPAPQPTVQGDGSAAATAAPTTTMAVPPLAPLSAVIDSRAMYYTALSLKTIVVSPGFAEAVKARAPAMDGTVTAVVAQDTNTMDIVVDGSSPTVAATTMSAALAELQSVVAAYLGDAGDPVRPRRRRDQRPVGTARDVVDQGTADVRGRARRRAPALVVPHPRRRHAGAGPPSLASSWSERPRASPSRAPATDAAASAGNGHRSKPAAPVR